MADSGGWWQLALLQLGSRYPAGMQEAACNGVRWHAGQRAVSTWTCAQIVALGGCWAPAGHAVGAQQACSSMPSKRRAGSRGRGTAKQLEAHRWASLVRRGGGLHGAGTLVCGLACRGAVTTAQWVRARHVAGAW